jgi:hypothetical protein
LLELTQGIEFNNNPFWEADMSRLNFGPAAVLISMSLMGCGLSEQYYPEGSNDKADQQEKRHLIIGPDNDGDTFKMRAGDVFEIVLPELEGERWRHKQDLPMLEDGYDYEKNKGQNQRILQHSFYYSAGEKEEDLQKSLTLKFIRWSEPYEKSWLVPFPAFKVYFYSASNQSSSACQDDPYNCNQPESDSSE